MDVKPTGGSQPVTDEQAAQAEAKQHDEQLQDQQLEEKFVADDSDLDWLKTDEELEKEKADRER